MSTKEEVLGAIVERFMSNGGVLGSAAAPRTDLGFVGKYVVVRCRDAGVHAGVLEHYEGRMCVLSEARRLWYWKPRSGAFLSSVAEKGIDGASKVGEPQSRLMLTENCEIAVCSEEAEKSIRSQPDHKP